MLGFLLLEVILLWLLWPSRELTFPLLAFSGKIEARDKVWSVFLRGVQGELERVSANAAESLIGSFYCQLSHLLVLTQTSVIISDIVYFF